LTDEIILGVDAGGTFTDFVCLELQDTPRLRVHKTLSNPVNPEQAILDGIAALGLDDLPESTRLHIIHGSTVATNAVLEGKLAKTALLCNEGLTDVLSLARQTRPALYALEFPPRQDPVPESLCLPVPGRIGADGQEAEALNDADIARLLDQLGDKDVSAVAINLLFSFLDDSHEQRLAAAIRAARPDLFVSASSSVLPVYKEYERGIATWLNAALGPVVHGYLSRLQSQLGRASLQVMQSNAETMSASSAAELAVNLLLSGPAGGLTALQFLGQRTGCKRFISFDMGGTSTDVALIDAAISTTSEGHIARYPVAVPMVDMHTIGAGGGSIAFVDGGGMLQVGPRSAGADPGPACYGRGGSEATVTDANLLLGRLLPTARLAGELQLDLEAARRAMAPLAEQTGLSLEEVAEGIVEIANEHMARAIRFISVNRGFDPQDFLLASFGGAGALHVCAIAELMQMNEAIVPVHGGLLSALGMLAASQGRQFTRTVNYRLDSAEESRLLAWYEELQAEGEAQLEQEGLKPEQLTAEWRAEMRYCGQSYSLNVPFENLAEASESFARLHEQRYGYCLSSDTEIVNLRVNVHARRQDFDLPQIEQQPGNEIAPVRVYGCESAVNVRERDSLAVDELLAGPLIITEYAATTYVAPGWQLYRDGIGNLRLQRRHGEQKTACQ
jgi:N-methylhydantoinase A